jgi:HK97 family phage major capsid protein
MRKSIELRNEKGELTHQYRLILDKASADKRKLNTEEQASIAKIDARFDELDTEIKQYEAQEKRESESSAGGHLPAAVEPQRDNATGSFKAKTIRGTSEYHAAVCAALFGGAIPKEISADVRNALTKGGSALEIRNALATDSDVEGGYLVASEQLAGRIIEIVDNEVFMRRMATKTTLTSSASLGIPARLTDVADPTWVAELATGVPDTSLTLAKRELKPHPLAQQILVSKKLLRLTPMVEELVLKRLGYKTGIVQEKAFLLGNGVEQPLGVFTPTTDGIDTSRDVVTGYAGNSNTPFITPTSSVGSADCLVTALYTLKSQYQAKATWIFHRTTIGLIRQIKDLYGQYVWQPGLSASEPDRVLNRPFYMSEYAPNTYTTGQYIGIVGDFSKYEIVDALDIEIQRLVELYALSNQVGFISRSETDGMPALAEAFVRVRCS